ncbi:TonB-dependent receptor domain-containing protein [Woeseia oceani]|uniref:TonB-dependent receptor n=1 Tax=Woeseia oceani TaxID=1548547 RepID=A0A193LLM8_9GAMM|nr:TonB-dependent receptor [Woeseia oceani]ANO53323.1 TonB-dependent receptor [Woeseia oceani]
MHKCYKYRHSGLRLFVSAVSALSLLGFAASAGAQQADDEVEEIVVTGSHIKGAKITGALPVSVVTSEDIEAMGVESGDQLLEFMAEQGQNFFSESENISGGVNSARGDIGAFNLRNLGTGNTLVLLNGRRMVNAASYQTEAVGGSFIPVNTVNSQSLPVFGLERVEVLRDGASAVYGADAVAGVVNYVLKTDFEGFNIRTRLATYDHMPRNDQRITLEWGKNFNGDATNLSVFADYYRRDRVNSQDEERWFNDDYRDRVPESSPWFGNTSFRNDSINSEYGQYDFTTGSLPGFTDSAGEFETYPAGDPRCQWDLGYGTCGAVDGQGTYRYSNNENRDLYGALDRVNVYAFLNHSFDNGVESFTEVSAYLSYTNTLRHASTGLSAVADLRVGANNYYNPFGAVGSPNRLPDSVIGVGTLPDAGRTLIIDNYRWAQVPRIVDNDGKTYRILQGFRGNWKDWDWDTAVTWSRAEKEDITHNRISNTLMQEALNDPTPAAFNPFGGRVNTNIERTLITVRRDNETELKMIDFKVSKNDLFEMPAGPAAFLAGVELREESFVDDRDPRLDGTINFIDADGNTFPNVSDVLNSSPSFDSRGERTVTSLFSELQIPLLENLDVQLALRYEDFDDIGDTTVGKFAVGWRPIEQVLLRGSWSQGFRVPNLVTVNEGDVARSNTRDDFVCFFADPDEDTLDCRYGMQRLAGGSRQLKPEESTNTNFGVVVEPVENLTFTLDFWEVEKERTIGLFGEENHTALDLLIRLGQGTANCAAVTGNPAVLREDPALLDPAEAQLYLDNGICPVGAVTQIDDTYANLDMRTVRGHDVGIYYEFDTPIGNFNMRYVASFLDKYEQVAGGNAAVLIAAQQSGDLPADVPVTGFADLRLQDGNAEDKHTLRVSWSRNAWGAALSGVRLGKFIQTSLTLEDPVSGDPIYYVIPNMTTWNVSADYRFDSFMESRARVQFGINNVFDERAPLADESFGYFGDMHTDLGINYFLDLKLSFD